MKMKMNIKKIFVKKIKRVMKVMKMMMNIKRIFIKIMK